MSDGYRFRLLVERRMRAFNLFTMPPYLVCGQQMVPIVHLTPTGLKILRFVWPQNDEGTIFVMPFEFPTLAPIELMGIDAISWVPVDGPVSIPEAVEIEGKRIPTYLQEIAMRATGRALQSAMLEKDRLSCPWVDRGCAVAQPKCQSIHVLNELPREGCAMRRYLGAKGITPERLVWGDQQ
jgi:hypothetical protein